MVKVDSRSKDEIVTQMVARAKSYTPEWNMNVENPDIATALALACADMLAGTLKKLNGTPLKNKIAFYNMTNASLLPASPSEGYVSFSLSADDVGCTPLEKGAVLTAFTPDGDTMHFETCDDILVSPAKIVKIFCTDDAEDYIGEYKDFEEKKTPLFELSPVNMQSHILRLSHPFAFDIRTEGQISLRFFRNGDASAPAEFVRALADPSVADIEYYAGEDNGFVRFAAVSEQDGVLLLVKNASQPSLAAVQEDGCNIRVTVKKVSALDALSFTRVLAAPSGSRLALDSATDGNVEFDIHAFYPFGERFQIFNEVYFCCTEALNKRGALITMNFDMSVDEIPITDSTDDGINWKWVANKKDFQETKPSRIAITSVIWEYFNGNGWSRLFQDSAYSDLFCIKQGVRGGYKTMRFQCPVDMCETFVGSRSGCYIRARLLKAENLYKTKGWYMSPHIRNVSFDYSYDADACRITDLVAYNNLALRRYDADAQAEGLHPFCRTGVAGRTVFFGFSQPPEQGPQCILWDFEETSDPGKSKLEWRYLSENGVKPLNMADETENFKKTGLTVFFGNRDFKKTALFGEELYWIMLTDAENAFARKKRGIPILKSIRHNTVKAVNTDSHNEEAFAMNVYNENASFTLASSGVLEFSLYVNEFSTITAEEISALEREHRIVRDVSVGGIDTEIWVKWNEVSSFVMEDGNSRSYIIDRSNGRFWFGDGRKGRIPPVSELNNIRVEYTTGGGERTNVGVDSITSLERSYGFLSSVTNPKRFFGGSDTETLQDAMKRSAVMLRTQGKIVTAHDLESLTFNASRSIRKLRCVNEFSVSGSGNRNAVTLVVLKKKDADFGRVKDEIKAYLHGRLPGSIVPGSGLLITEPTFVKINVRVEIKTDIQSGIFELKKRVERCLADYFSSFAGEDGDNVWQIGSVPNEQQIRSALLRLKNVEYIRNLYVTMYISGADGLREVDADSIGQYRYILPENGEHDISVIIE